MAGMKEQAKLASQILKSIRDDRESDANQLLDKIESQVAGMRTTDIAEQSSREHESGRAMVKDSLVRTIRKIKSRKAERDFNAKSEINDLISFYDRLAEKL